jgi:protein SCO1/2
MAQRTLRYAILVLAALMLVGIGIWAFVHRDRLERLSSQGENQPSKAIAGVTIGGPFTLTNHRGETVTEKSFDGRWRLVFFGFIHCPDICPTKLTNLGMVMELLGDQAAKIVPIFVTVDPERDTVAVMKDYVAAFDSRLVGLTGSPAQIDAMVKSFRVYAQKVPLKDKPESRDYTVDHSAYTYIFGPNNEFIDVMAYDLTPEKMAERIRSNLQ